MLMSEQIFRMHKNGMTVDEIVKEFNGVLTPAVVFKMLIDEGVDVSRMAERITEVMQIGAEGTVPVDGADDSWKMSGRGPRGERIRTDGERFLRGKVVDAYVDGHAMRTIRATYGMTTLQVYGLLAEEGVPIRKYASNTMKARIRLEAEIIEMYAPVVGMEKQIKLVWDEEEERYVERLVDVEVRDSLKGYALHDITMALGFSNTTILEIVKKHGIEGRMARTTRLKVVREVEKDPLGMKDRWTASNEDTDNFWVNEME